MGISVQRAIAHMAGTNGNAVLTLNAHCASLYPNVASNRFSPVRAVLRNVQLGALANGATRYPALPGKAYAAALTAALAGASPEATAQAAATAMGKAARVWQAPGVPEATAQRVAQRVQAAKASAAKAGAKAAKAQAKATAPVPEPTAQA